MSNRRDDHEKKFKKRYVLVWSFRNDCYVVWEPSTFLIMKKFIQIDPSKYKRENV